MSEGINRVVFLGNLGADPELRVSPDRTSVLTLRLATTEVWFDKNKERQERTEWHSVVVFGARAEALSRILTKGACILVEGGLRTSSYEKDGVKRYKTEVYAQNVCLTARRQGADSAPPMYAPWPAAAAGNNGKTVAPEPIHDELPF